MKWIDQDFYNTKYAGTPIEADKFEPIANAAERVIDSATQFRLSQNDFSTYAAFIQQMVKMAISAQIEYFYELGSHTEAGMQTVQSASIGGFSFTNPAKDPNKSQNLLRSDAAMNYLGATGLMYAGVHARVDGWDNRDAGFWGDYDIY